MPSQGSCITSFMQFYLFFHLKQTSGKKTLSLEKVQSLSSELQIVDVLREGAALGSTIMLQTCLGPLT